MKNAYITIAKYLAGALLSATSAQALAADFFVRPGGSGNGASWSTAAGSPGSAPSGSTVYVAGGSYGNWNLSGKSNLVVRRATASSHGSDTGWVSSYDSQVVLTGGGDCINITSGSGGITIDGVVKNGIWAYRCGYHSIRSTVPNMTFRNLELGAEGTNRNGEDGIQGGGDNLLVENCFIHGNDSAETHGDGIQWFSGNNVVMRYNIFKNNGQHMMLTETAWGNDYVTNLEIHHNVFYNRGGAHYNGLSKKLCPPTGIWKVYHNTFDLESTNDSGYNNIFSGAGSCTAMEFRNNAVLNSHAGSLGNVTHAYNGYDNSAPYLTYQIPSTETGKVVAADLGMVNVAAADYHLTASSPLIGKGQNLGYTRDFDGKPLPTNPSMGAFEYAGSVAPAPVLAAPSNLRSTAVSASSISIAWDYSGSSQSSFNVRRKTGSAGTYANIASVSASSRSYANSGLLASTQYCYQVQAADASSVSANSNEICVTTSASTTTPPPPANVAPSVSITSPANGASFSAGMSIAINASASDSDGSVAKVEFFNGSTKLGEDLTSPYSLTMSNAAAGSYSLKARATDNAGATKDSATVSITVNAVTQPPPSGTSVTLLTSQVPAQQNLNDGVAYELGMKFTSTVSGKITGIRFFKGSSESGTRTGKIYSSTGALLASVTFPAGTASGWQQATLASPLSIAANTQYTVSVNTGANMYVATTNGMATQISNGSLRSVVGSNGVYGPVGARPTSSYQNSNYFRDIVFVADSSSSPSPAPVASTITVDNLAAGASSSAVSFTGKWCASSLTPYYGNASLYSCSSGTTVPDTYTLRPNVVVAQQYDVYIQYVAYSNRSKSVAVTITHAAGTASKTIDQSVNGSQFVLLGRYSFNVGTAGSVKISQVSSPTAYASIDAIRLIPVP